MKKTDKKWATEASRRLTELRFGKIQAIPSDKIFTKVWKRIESMILGASETDDEKKPLTLLNCSKIHVPCFPYFGSVYMTLLSVMQGIVLAYIFLPFTSLVLQNKFIEIIKAIPILLLAVTLWHKYVNHHQILGWQLGPMDTIIVALFGLLQAVMVSIANLQRLAEETYKFNEIDFDNKFLLLLFCYTASVFLGVIAYAHSGAKASEKYVEKVVIEHYNSCPKSNNGKNHCIPQAKDLYNFLIGFEALAVFGTTITAILSFFNILLYIFLTKKCGISIETSSIISTASLCTITLIYLLKYDLKHEISDNERTDWITSIGYNIVNQKRNHPVIYWTLKVPYLVFSYFPLYGKQIKKSRMIW